MSANHLISPPVHQKSQTGSADHYDSRRVPRRRNDRSMIAERLANRATALAAERVPFVQATVVRAGRPASVRAGATALVLGDGTIEGFVGGHCAEPSVRLHALRALETGEALLLRIEPGAGAGAAVEGAVTEHNPCLSGGPLEIFLDAHLPPPRL